MRIVSLGKGEMDAGELVVNTRPYEGADFCNFDIEGKEQEGEVT